MAVPTISSITPAIGLSSGDTLVTIEGTNYVPLQRTPVGQVNGNDSLIPPPTVIVLFDGVVSPRAVVRSSTLIEAVTPPGFPGPTATGRTVAVTVINLDPTTGQPVSGESVSAPNAFTYTRPRHTSEYESDFTRATRTLLTLITNQVIAQVDFAVQTDYDATTGDELHVTEFAKLPGIVLVGPNLTENRFYSINEQPDIPSGDISKLDGQSPSSYFETRVPYTVDITWEVHAVSNSKMELLNLMANFIQFMHRNKWLVMDRDPKDATKGTVRYEMDFAPDGQPRNSTVPNNSNVRSWVASIVIRGFDIEAFSGLLDDGAPDPSHLVPAHAVIDKVRAADNVQLDPAVQLGIPSDEAGD